MIIAGGGTGGHILPALAIAKAVKDLDPDVDIHFVGTAKGLETRLVPKENFPLHLIPVSGIKNLSIKNKIKAFCQLPFAFFKSMQLIMKLKPDVVLGVGGYASGPLLLMAAFLRKKTILWEPNAHPGLTNRILSRFVPVAIVVFKDSQKYLRSQKILPMGMPLRKGIEAKPREPHSTLRVLIFGGSQGARGINNTVSESLLRGGDWLEGVEFVHQTGALDFERISRVYKEHSVGVDCQAFLYDMEKRYAWADLVICRSGANTVAEIAAAQKAAVFVPFPYAADDHQKKNAESLAERGAAILVEQMSFTPDKFIELIKTFKSEPDRISQMEKLVYQFHQPNASHTIAQLLL